MNAALQYRRLKMRWILTAVMLLSMPVMAVDAPPSDTFAFTFTVELPGSPETVYTAATGDITGWWDHSMSDQPHEMYIEPKPGGAFMEIFDESGDGVRHAVVTYAKTNEMLRMEGPMGLAGSAILMVTTWTLSAAENGNTDFTIQCNASGEVYEGWGEVVEKTWRHFIDERLRGFLNQ
jgi:uncharacterized protein YndB with AHSA1/START domain